jgi:ribosomal protein S18 acetylase RimI-like enzyme
MGPVRGGVRRATAADLDTLVRLNAHVQGWHAVHHPDTFLATPDPAAVRAHFADALADPTVTVLLSGDPAAAYTLCTLRDRPANAFSPPRRRLSVDQIATDQAHRRQGHARALLDAACALAREHGCHEIILDTWADNADAHAVFRAMGFAPQRHLFARRP